MKIQISGFSEKTEALETQFNLIPTGMSVRAQDLIMFSLVNFCPLRLLSWTLVFSVWGAQGKNVKSSDTGLPCWLSGKESVCQGRKCEFDP